MLCSMPGFHVAFCLQEFAQVDAHLISDSIQPCHCVCELIQFSSVVQFCPTLGDPQFSCSVLSNSWWPHGLQHARTPCSSPTSSACSNTCPSSQWCHTTISCSVISLLLLPSILPSIRVFANESVLHIRSRKYWTFSFNISPSINIQDWFPLGLTSLISLQSKGLSTVISNTTVQKHQFFCAHPSL